MQQSIWLNLAFLHGLVYTDAFKRLRHIRHSLVEWRVLRTHSLATDEYKNNLFIYDGTTKKRQAGLASPQSQYGNIKPQLM